MQRFDDEDLKIIGREQTTTVFWKATALYHNPSDRIGALSVEETAMLATTQQFDVANDSAGIFQDLEPGSVIELAEGYFILDAGDFPPH